MKSERTENLYRILIAALILAAAALRLYQLDLRPLHHDEGVNALFMLRLIEHGVYRYDPHNYHGPLLYYLTFIPLRLLGLKSSLFQASDPQVADFAFRLAPALLGTLLVALVTGLRAWLGRLGTCFSMALLAFSPSFLYYSRDNIHEIYLVFFTLAAFVCLHRWGRSGRTGFLCLGAVCLGLMFTVKETAVLTLAVWAVSLTLCGLVQLLSTAGSQTAATSRFREAARRLAEHPLVVRAARPWPWLAAAGLFAAVIAVFFSSFFTHLSGIGSFFSAFGQWFATGTVRSEHTKPIIYFLDIMFRNDGPILLFGLLGAMFGLIARRATTVFAAAWALLTTLMYSAIPYKTPWLALNMLLPLALLAGRGLQELWEARSGRGWRFALPLLAALTLIRPAHQALALSFRDYDDDTRGLVYVQTYRDLRQLVSRVGELAKSFQGPDTRILVASPQYWPLPWYLRDFRQALWYGRMVEVPDAPLIIAESLQEEVLDGKLTGRFSKEHYRLRPGASLTLYFRVAEPDPEARRSETLASRDPGPSRARLRPGLQGEVFAGSRFAGGVRETRVDGRIDFAFHREEEKPLRAPFSIEWSGFLLAPEKGRYRFACESDDGSWLYLDDRLVVDNGGEHGLRRVEGEVDLEAGLHLIRVKYFDQHFGAIMRLSWVAPGRTESLLGDGHLFHLPAE